MTIKSAIVDNEVFLQGEFLSIGINRDGSLGTRTAAPTGFNSDIDSGFLRVGMFADLDGFGKGNATQLNDAVMLGRTIEGFNIGYKVGGDTIVQSNQSLTGFSEIDGTNRNGSTASIGQSTWSGVTDEKLAVSQKITLADDAKFIRIDVTLTNNSSVAMNDVRYMRTADPDQGPSFSTNNVIERQGNDGALVASYVGKSSTPFFLFSDDDRAVVSTYGFVNADPYAAAAYSNKQAAGYSKAADQTVNITFGLGTLAAGASTVVTLYMGVTDDLAATIAKIDGQPSTPTPPVVVDLAPVVGADKLTVEEDETGRGNVLSNDRDPEGQKLTAALKSGPANGTVKLAADGSYSYAARDGFTGTDSFTYTASDGKNATVGTVTLTVTEDDDAPPPVLDPVKPVNTLLTRAGTQDGSSAADQVLTGPAYQNSFFFDVAKSTGNDTIANFGNNDVIVVNKALYDGNRDGIISLSKSKLNIDAPNGNDTVVIAGTSALRLLGTDENGMVVYADASVRPKGATESKLGDDRLTGDAGDKKKNVFFFDTALDIDLGDDRVDNFGARDIIVTTSKLVDGDNDGSISLTGGVLRLTGGTGGPGDSILAGEGGTVDLHLLGGASASALEFDGSVVRNGTTYYVYSLDGSAAGLADLGF
jgi:VCBS repeat-containing protein